MANNNNFMNWNDGEGLTSADLINMQRLLQVRLTDERFFSRMVEVYSAGPNGLDSYDTAVGTALFGQNIFSFGAGLTPKGSTLTVTGSAGLAMVEEVASTEPKEGANDYDRIMDQFYWDNGTVATLNANASGNDRYDLVSIDIAEAAGTATARDFKDGTTGVLSSNTPNKRVALSPTWTVTEGTPAGSPTIPALPANNKRWAAFRVPNGGSLTYDDSGGYPGIIDFTYPCKVGLVCPVTPGRLVFGDDSWYTSDDVGYQSIAGGGVGLFRARTTSSGEIGIWVPPAQFCGNHNARLLGFQVLYSFQTGADAVANFEVGRLDLADSSFTSIKDVVSSMTQDGFDQADHFSTVGSTSDPTDFPIWGNGYAAGRSRNLQQTIATDLFTTVAIRLTKAANGSGATVYAIRWIFAI